MTSTVTRPDTRLPQSRAGGQGLYLRSLDHLGRSSEAKDRKNPKKVKCDGPTNRKVTYRDACLRLTGRAKNLVLAITSVAKTARFGEILLC